MAKKTSKEVSVKKDITNLTTMTQQDIPALLAKVTEQIIVLKGSVEEAPKTTGDLGGFGKIKDIKTVSELIKAHSSVVNKERVYNESAKEILPAGVKKPPFILDGSPASAWITDIKRRISVVAHKEQLDKLNKIKTLLENNLSTEAKLANDLAKAAELLND